MDPHNGNGRYFTDENGKAVYLSGSHTWNNFLDGGWEAGGFHNPDEFQFESYLNWMQSLGHNFIRLWTPENSRDFDYCVGQPGCPASGYSPVGNPVTPTLYERLDEDCNTPECFGNDGQRKFDLTKLNPAYFCRLRDHILAAKAKNIYVSIMLFDSWGVGVYQSGCYPPGVWWLGHPYDIGNNINMVHGWPDSMHARNDGVACNTSVNDVGTYQQAYIEKVIDTVKDLDNVLFEIDNEGLGYYGDFSPIPDGIHLNSTDWQYSVIKLIKSLEESADPNLYYRHPVGMTSQYWGTNDELTDSDADWISLGYDYFRHPLVHYETDPPPSCGDKVIILDTDHLPNNLGEYDRYNDPPSFDNRATRTWVWKCFTRGYNSIYMDQLYADPAFGGAGLIYDVLPSACASPRSLNPSPHAGEVRDAMGDTRCYADRMNLVEMTPQPTLSSTGYVLAKVGEEYLVYQPGHGEFTVSVLANTYAVEWFDPVSGEVVSEPDRVVLEDDDEIFTPPDWLPEKFMEDAVLFLTIYERAHIESRPRH